MKNDRSVYSTRKKCFILKMIQRRLPQITVPLHFNQIAPLGISFLTKFHQDRFLFAFLSELLENASHRIFK